MSTKQCWSCEAITPYEVGWCDECRKMIPIGCAGGIIAPEPFGGRIRMAIADAIKQLRRPPPAPRQAPGRKALNLGDLGL